VICDIFTQLNCAEISLNVRIITQVVGEFCASECFHKFASCRRVEDTTKIVSNYGKA